MNLDAFRQQLLEQLAALRELENTASEAAGVVQLDQTSVGRLSRMDALQGQAMAKAAQLRRKQEILLIEAALLRIQKDEFGDCIECDEAISEARLKHNPAAFLCLRCAQLAEN